MDYSSNCRFWFAHYQALPGDVIVDVGAGRGEDLAEMLRAVGPTGRVIAIEAHPEQFRYLWLSWFRELLVNPLNFAVMDKAGIVKIENGAEWESNGLAAGGVPVTAAKLDDLLRPFARVDFLKMNIEGSEREALAGAGETLSRVRAACICAHDFRADRGEGERYRTRAFVETALQAHGFQTIVTPGWDHVHAWRAA